jgi:hypothetical protein
MKKKRKKKRKEERKEEEEEEEREKKGLPNDAHFTSRFSCYTRSDVPNTRPNPTWETLDSSGNPQFGLVGFKNRNLCSEKLRTKSRVGFLGAGSYILIKLNY